MSHSEQDEIQDFFDAFSDVRPVKGEERVNLHSPTDSIAQKQKVARQQTQHRATTFNPLSMEGVTPVKPEDFLSFQQAGIQDGVFKNLRMGKYPLERRLSLKGISLQESREVFYQGLKQSHAKGARCLLIQHGKGEQSKPFPALKKSYVNHWLQEMDIVIAYHTAQPVHGGSGATYVLLKKHPDQKLINREKNRKG